MLIVKDKTTHERAMMSKNLGFDQVNYDYDGTADVDGGEIASLDVDEFIANSYLIIDDQEV
jgi:hypothetical protein